MRTRGDFRLRRGDLVEATPDVHGRCACAALVAPGKRTVERQIDLEHARPVAVAHHTAAVAAGQPIAGDANELTGRDVEEQRARRLELVERPDGAAALDLSTERAELGGQGIGNGLRASP